MFVAKEGMVIAGGRMISAVVILLHMVSMLKVAGDKGKSGVTERLLFEVFF